MSKPAAQLRGRAARLARLMPSRPSKAARTPFVLLVVALLAGGLITLLVLNSALNEGSFRLSELKKRTTELTDEQQALQRDVDNYSKPDALERRARELGMVPGGSPAFLGPDGKVRGVPSEASAAPAPPSPRSTGTPSARPAAGAASRSAARTPPTPSGTTRPTAPAAPSTTPRTPADQPSTSPGR
ncbi:septum formation initiator family protein [Streptomyces sp. NPDC014685]|uniref:FtsB family cell division protein n=1 Tax=Streptomyces sp. NPDC014685 TaxID=3364881 RepID=UPI003701EB5E